MGRSDEMLFLFRSLVLDRFFFFLILLLGAGRFPVCRDSIVNNCKLKYMES